jgi:GR25 family glycosyltransferase involved in LPS biosynthesis
MASIFEDLSKDPDSVALHIKSGEEVVISQQPSDVTAHTEKGTIFSYKPSFKKNLVKITNAKIEENKNAMSIPSMCQYTEHITNDINNKRKINTIFPNIYLITLLEDDNKKRLIHTKYVLKNMGANYTICYMSRPSEELYNDYLRHYESQKGILKSSNSVFQKLSKTELGCLLSHTWVLKNLENPHIKHNKKGISKLNLILEDDIMPIHDFDNKLTKLIEETPKIIHGKLIMLASTDYHIEKRDIKANSYIPTGPHIVCSTGAYAINSKEAQKLTKEMSSCLKPADHYFKIIFDTVKSKSEGFVIYPPLLWLDISQSTIGNERELDSDEYNLKLARCYPKLNLDNYDLLPLVLLSYESHIEKIKKLLPSHNFLEDLENTFNNDNLIEKNWLNAFRRSSWNKKDLIDFFNEISKQSYVDTTPSDIAVCISFFNPSKRQRPLQNILYCLNKLYNAEIPVYLLELVYEGRNPELQHLPNSFKIESNSVMFHKENLWNILEKKVPEKYTKLLFIDSDIIFKEINWPVKISNILNTCSVIQPFTSIELLDITYRVVDTRISCTKAKSTRPVDIFDSLFKYPTTGFGLACCRDWFRKIGGFHEWCIMGGGDRFIITNICNRIISNDVCYTDQPYTHESYESKKALFRDVSYGSADLTIQHLFHGRYTDRQYSSRHEKTKSLKKEDFYKNSDGLIQFNNPEKWNSIVLEYFNNRNDDSI